MGSTAAGAATALGIGHLPGDGDEHMLTCPPATFRKLPHDQRALWSQLSPSPTHPFISKRPGLALTAVPQAGKRCMLGNTAENPSDERRWTRKRRSVDSSIKSCFLSVFMQLNH